MEQASVIMVIRHAEKADRGSGGVLQSGEDNRNSLSVRGWQRAGALVALFAPGQRQSLDSRLPQPAVLISEFADAPGSEEKHSKREEQTLGPLAEKLGITPDFSFGKGQEAEAAAAARRSPGPVLIAWEHKNLIKLASALTADPLPERWPKERYDLVLLFRLRPDGTGYSCEQIPQLLLAGDQDTNIA